jgi:hypothetical protein
MAGTLIFSQCCPADDSEDQVIYVVSGKISAIDTFKSTITVKSFMSQPVIKYINVDIFIGPDTKIMRKNNISISSIFDLVMGNVINVRFYYKDTVPQALQIEVIK